jgi:tripartite-type tricarboxylate transporter receptor subunit TctC
MLTRRSALASFAALAAAGGAWGQSAWPSRPVRIVMPGPAGIAPDVFARWYANELQKALGQPFTVDNRPGASGILGADAVAKAAPDGTTLLYGYNQLVTMNPHLFSKLPYNAEKDLVPVSLVATGCYVLCANNNLPASNMKEFIALAKKENGRLAYGSYGPGTGAHLGMELIQGTAGIQLTHVPYKGGVMTDVMSGQIAVALEPSASAVPLVKGGKLKALGVTSATRLEALPDVRPIGDTIPGYELLGWNAFWVPAGTPPAIVQKLQEEAIRISRLPETGQRMRAVGFEPAGTTAQEMAAIIKRESEQMAALIKAKGIRLD